MNQQLHDDAGLQGRVDDFLLERGEVWHNGSSIQTRDGNSDHMMRFEGRW
jgi:hypothetical protein